MLLRRPVGTRRGPGLLGSMARTAVVAGTATATAGAVHRWSERRQAEAAEVRAAQQAVHDQQMQPDDQVQADRQVEQGEQRAQPLGQAQADQRMQGEQQGPITRPDGRAGAQPTQDRAARAGSVTPGVDLMSQLRQLADLRAAGVLTEAEFTAAKAKLLGT